LIAQRREFGVFRDPVRKLIFGEDGKLGTEGSGTLDELGGFEVVGFDL